MPPHVRYGTACSLTRVAIGSVSCSIALGMVSSQLSEVWDPLEIRWFGNRIVMCMEWFGMSFGDPFWIIL
jgi:hypothetical protein